MKTIYIFLLGAIGMLLPQYASAYEQKETDANIIGHVIDKHTREHLAYVTIALKGTTIGTTTDATGHYFLKNLPEGDFTLEVASVGYKTVRQKVRLTRGKSLEMNFEIEEDMVALDGVVVSANRNETTRRTAPTLVNVVSVKTFENTTSLLSSEGAIAPATFSFFSIRTLFLRSGCSFCSFLSAGAATGFSEACWALSAASAVSAFATLGEAALAGRPLLRPSTGFLASFSFIFSA